MVAWKIMTGFALLLLLCFAGCTAEADQSLTPPERLPVTISGRTFHLEPAITREQITTGLSGRAHIPANGGMIFIFDAPASRSFWMKGCLVPIDIIFLDPGGRIVSMHRMAPEPGVPDGQLRAYPSRWPAQFAIELAGGTLDDLELQVAQVIALPLADLKRWAE